MHNVSKSSYGHQSQINVSCLGTKTTRPAATKAASTKKTVSRTAPIAVAKVEKPNLNLSNDLNGVEVVGEMLGTFLLVSMSDGNWWKCLLGRYRTHRHRRYAL